MSRISAADNLIIDAQPTRWRIQINENFVDGLEGDGLLAEAMIGSPLRYAPVFAKTRRLPKDGTLSTSYVSRVVLGWSWDDDAWHLGLILREPLATARGSRWCELARWPDPEKDLYRDLAEEAGKALAHALNRPFNLIPLREGMTEPTPVVVPLPELPLKMQGWSLGKAAKTGWLVFVRDEAWARERKRQILSDIFWALVYVLLSVATLLSDIALPRPVFLPYLGLATAVALLGRVLYSAWELRNRARRIILDPTTRRMWGTATRGGKPVWRKGREEIDSVYVSEVVKPHGDSEDGAAAADILHGEINLRLTTGTFYFLLKQDEEETVADPLVGNPDEVRPLENDEIKTKLQAAAAYIAEGLDVPLWYDYRLK